MPFQLTAEFNDAARPQRHKRIVETFTEYGAESLGRFAEYLRTETDFYTPEEKAHYELLGITSDVRRALKHPDDSGLPHCGPTTQTTDEGKPVWAVRSLFKYEDYCLAFTAYQKLGRENFEIADHYKQECIERFRKAPVELNVAGSVRDSRAT